MPKILTTFISVQRYHQQRKEIIVFNKGPESKVICRRHYITMKLASALLLAMFASLMGNVSCEPASYLDRSKPQVTAISKDPTSTKPTKKIHRPADMTGDMTSRHLQVSDLPLNEPIMLPSPFGPADNLGYTLPPQGDFSQLHCYIAGDYGDIDFEIFDADSGALLCSAIETRSNEKCTVILFPDQGAFVNVSAYEEATDAEFGCHITNVAEVSLGEDIPIMFDDATQVTLYYSGDTLEALKCSLTGAVDFGGDIQMNMYAKTSDGFPEALCISHTFSAKECATLSFPEDDTIAFVVLEPFHGTTIPSGEVILNCRNSAIAEVTLGDEVDVTFEDADVLFTATFEDGPTSLRCNVLPPADYEGDVDLQVYELGNPSNNCYSSFASAKESCDLNLESPAAVLIKLALLTGDPLVPVALQCFAGPVVELELGASIPVDMKKGDLYTYNFKSDAAPSQIVCSISSSDNAATAGSLVLGLWASTDPQVDQRVVYSSLDASTVHMGVFYEGMAMMLQVTAFDDQPVQDATLECLTKEANIASLEWGVTTVVNLDKGDATFFPLEVGSALSNVVCTTAGKGSESSDVDLAMSPIGAGFEKTIALAGTTSNHNLIWPWTVEGTTFHVLVEEYYGSNEVVVGCQLEPLDVLTPDVPVAFSVEDFMADYKLRFLGDSFVSIWDVEPAKVFYMEVAADAVPVCTLEFAEGVTPELLVFDVADDGSLKSKCQTSGGALVTTLECFAFIDSGKMLVAATTPASAPNTEMTLVCKQEGLTPAGGFPEEVSEDEVAEAASKAGPFDRF